MVAVAEHSAFLTASVNCVWYIGTSTKAFSKGVETWKRETILKKVIP